MLSILTSFLNKKRVFPHFFHLILISLLFMIEKLTQKEQEDSPALTIHDILCRRPASSIHVVWLQT